MKRDEQQSSMRRFFASRAFLVIALIITTSLTIGFARAYYQDFKVKQEIEHLQKEVGQLEQKKLHSMEILKYVTTDQYVEDIARTELNMKKPGENVAIINDLQKTNTSSQDESQPQDGQIVSNPVKWFYYFIHKPLPSIEGAT